jgi:hypothetical protein
MQRYLYTIILLLTVISSRACDCITQDLDYYTSNVKFIFTAKVIKQLDTAFKINYTFPNGKLVEEKVYIGPYSYRVIVEIVERLKASGQTADTLEFDSDSSNCDPSYKFGETYLFFAERLENGKYKMVRCAPWGTVKTLSNELNDIRRWSRRQRRQKQIGFKEILSRWPRDILLSRLQTNRVPSK